MHPVLKSLLVLLLLACDFAGDPSQGTCPWSPAWGNQAACCPSLSARANVLQAGRLAPSLDVGLPPVGCDIPLPLLLPSGTSPAHFHAPSAAARVYALRTLRR